MYVCRGRCGSGGCACWWRYRRRGRCGCRCRCGFTKSSTCTCAPPAPARTCTFYTSTFTPNAPSSTPSHLHFIFCRGIFSSRGVYASKNAVGGVLLVLPENVKHKAAALQSRPWALWLSTNNWRTRATSHACAYTPTAPAFAPSLMRAHTHLHLHLQPHLHPHLHCSSPCAPHGMVQLERRLQQSMVYGYSHCNNYCYCYCYSHCNNY